jgi:hypothetical protein
MGAGLALEKGIDIGGRIEARAGISRHSNAADAAAADVGVERGAADAQPFHGRGSIDEGGFGFAHGASIG